MGATPCRARDHPRMRGEHVLRGTMQADDMGSSPHARGAREAPDACLTLGGIIPACAGSTDPQRPPPCRA